MTETATTITTTTTGTTTTATYANAEEGLLALVTEKSSSWLQRLASSQEAVLTDERPDGVIFAAEVARGGLRHLEIPLTPLPGEPVMRVWVPEEVFHILQRNDSKLAMLGAVPKDLRGFGSGGVQLEAVAVLDTFTFGNENLEIADLETPIEFTLPVDYRPGLVCGFWDESARAWSTQGLALAAGNAAGEFVRCATRHLTLFGAFFMGLQEAIICSQFSLLNADALAELAKSDWLAAPGALLFWSLLLALLGICLLALLLDKWRGAAFCWRSEFFLVPLHGGPEESTVDDASASEDEEEEEERQHQGCMQVAAAFVGGMCMCKDNAFRDALDEIISEYFEQFSELRTVIEAVWEGLEVGALRAGRLFYVSRSIMEKLVLSSSRRTVGASMGLSGSAVQFVLSDRHLRDLLMERHHRRVAQESLREGARQREEASYSMVAQRSLGTSGSSATVLAGSAMTRSSTRTGLADQDAKWWSLQKREDAWAALHDEICERMYSYVAGHHWTSVPRMTWATFVRNNPLGNIFTTNIFMGSEMQALFLILELVGDLLVVCLFFSASGRAKGKASQGEADACSGDEELEEGIAYKMGRVLAVAMGSVVFAALPVNFLRSLHPRKFKKLPYEGCPEWQRQLRAWRLQDRLVWALGSLYLGCGLLYIALFLANISAEGLISLLQDTVVLPFIVALCMPLLAGIFLSAVGSAGRMDHQELVRSVQTSLHSQTNAMLPISCI